MNFKSKSWNCPVCGKRTVNLRLDPLTKEICYAADKLMPIQKYQGLNREGLIDLLIAEL
jgi:hypothetical protein